MKILNIELKTLVDSPTKIVMALASCAFVLSALLAGATFAVHKKTLLAAVLKAPPQLKFDPAGITAKAAVIYDPQNEQVIFSKNSDASLPLASLTKLMTAQTVLRLTQNSNPAITITDKDLQPEGDWGLAPGSVWKLDDLLAFGLVASSNDAMAAAANASSPRIIDEMNRTAGELGLYQTYFLNPTGLDIDPENAGAYGSAADVARLAAAFLKTNPRLFEQTSRYKISISSAYGTLSATSTDVPILDIPGLVAAKTGYTDLAGGNLVAVFDVEIGRPIVIAVLGSTREARFSDVRTLIDALRNALTTGRLSRI